MAVYTRKSILRSLVAATTGSFVLGWQMPVLAQGMLEEVIVTAQKREQSLQDVPIAVSAYSGAMLQETGVKDVFDLQVNAPGLAANQNQNATTSTFAIRGIGGGGNNFGIESSVGVYVDGAYRARQNAMISQLVDMESIEVLRGPQGTLFGRNTLSGAIHFKTQAPDHEGTGFLEGSIGAYDLRNLNGAKSFSIIEDVLAVRFTGFSSARDGWVDNLTVEGTDEIFDRDRFGVRAQALYTPTDNLSIRVIADHGEIDEVCCGTTVLNDNNRVDQRSPAGAFGTDAILDPRGGTFIPESRIFDNVVTYNFNPTSESVDKGVSVQVDWDFSDSHTLTSISAWRDFESFDRIDADFTDLSALEDTNLAEQSSFSQEFRVAYTGENLNYVIGANYFTQDLDSTSTLTFGDDTEAIAAAFLGLPPAVTVPLQFPLSPGGQAPALFFAPGGSATDFNKQEHESWAIFGQADWQLSDEFTLTVGLRYSDEEKILNTTYVESGTELGFFTLAFPATFAREDLDIPPLEDDQVTGTVKLSWFATDTTMLFASISTGYKAGGTNTDRIDPAFDQVFGPETSISYEMGMKAEFPDQAMRLNVALYYTPVDDFQVGTFTGSGFNVQNAATVDTYGGEVEWLWQVTDNTRLQAAYAMTIADFDAFERGNCWVITPFRFGTPDPGGRYNVGTAENPEIVTAADPRVTDPLRPTFCDRSGGRLGTNPEHFFVLSGRQEFRLSDSVSGFALGEFVYYGDMVLDQSNEPLSLQDAHNLINIRAGIYLENYDAEITLWGRNVLDEDYNSTSFPGVLQDGKQIAYRREPVTWGLTFRKDW
ncbi:MAG: TonB-dependent receptor [Pseudomonadota bacterium]